MTPQVGTPAGFGIRSVAYLIDFAVLIALYVLYLFIQAIHVVVAWQSAFAGSFLVIALLAAWVWILAVSPGKRAFGLHVLRPDGSKVGLGRKFCRSLAKLFLSLDFGLMIAFRKDKRGIHDLICDTVVVRP